ncbi:MAG: hypothetical protein GY761_15755 [Hyphomicrobiales bacterium]|nr:hypothetical protein [Hyphomicrobiales bacterium]
MKLSIAFLGVLSTVFVVAYSMDAPTGDYTGAVKKPIEKSADATEWQLTISGVDNHCKVSFTAQTENFVSSRDMSNCISVFPDLDYLAKIGMDPNGDITLYHKNGSKLVEFMESESIHHESFWPAHPLMTLVRADTL